MTASKKQLPAPTELELTVLALLALKHPKAVDAIDLFNALWLLNRFPIGITMEEAMQLMVKLATQSELRGYAQCVDDAGEVFYSLSPAGALLFIGDREKTLLDEMKMLPAWRTIQGGKPC